MNFPELIFADFVHLVLFESKQIRSFSIIKMKKSNSEENIDNLQKKYYQQKKNHGSVV